MRLWDIVLFWSKPKSQEGGRVEHRGLVVTKHRVNVAPTESVWYKQQINGFQQRWEHWSVKKWELLSVSSVQLRSVFIFRRAYGSRWRHGIRDLFKVRKQTDLKVSAQWVDALKLCFCFLELCYSSVYPSHLWWFTVNEWMNVLLKKTQTLKDVEWFIILNSGLLHCHKRKAQSSGSPSAIISAAKLCS